MKTKNSDIKRLTCIAIAVMLMTISVISAQEPPPTNDVIVDVTPDSLTGMPGDILTYNVNLTNNGTVPDIIHVDSITGVPTGWTVELNAAVASQSFLIYPSFRSSAYIVLRDTSMYSGVFQNSLQTLPYSTPTLPSKTSHFLTLDVHVPETATSDATMTINIHSQAQSWLTDNDTFVCLVMPNNPPTLSSSNVDPLTGDTTTTFTYSVTYTDADNDAPSTINVIIDGTPHAMTVKTGEDGDYTNGEIYDYATTGAVLAIGTHTYQFNASDAVDYATGDTGIHSGPTVASVNNPPALSAGAADPTSGNATTTFTYSVTYTDADNDAPSVINVIIDGTPHAMTVRSGQDGDYANGEIYEYATTGTVLGGGSHTYQFNASDAVDYATGDTGIHSGPTVTIINNPPALSAGAVNPATGDTTTTFTYSVTYTDADNDAPSTINVIIDGTPHAMTVKPGGDGDYTNGEIYEYATTGAVLGEGTHTFQYNASDGVDYATGDTGIHSGPTVAIINNPPTLSAGAVDPTSGNATTTFTYSVTYTDADNDAPTVINVIIDGTPYAMTVKPGEDGDYANGEIYDYITTGAVLGGGTHTFQFNASDGVNYATGDTGSHSGPTVTSVNIPPVLSAGAVNPTSGDTTTTFTYSVTYTDADNDAPSTINVIIDGTPQAMTVKPGEDGDYTNGEIYDYATTGAVLGIGPHTYQFNASDGVDYATGDTGIHSGPTVTSVNIPPALSAGAVDPTSGNATTTFTYSVTYTDADNDAPSTINVIVGGTPYALTVKPGEDGDYTNGEIYEYTTTGAVLGWGTHTFQFNSSDGVNYATGDTGSHSGPTVTIVNNPPVLSAGAVNPTSGNATTTFTYSVTYTDADNDAPSTINVIIDGTPQAMTVKPGEDGDYTNGEIYDYATTGAVLGIGPHTYQFNASGGVDYATGDTGIHSGPTVTSVNIPPALSAGAVDPTSGNATTTFTYSVTYTDADNDAPSTINVIVGGTPHAMTVKLGEDGDYTNGEIYEYTTTGAVLGWGTHIFQFTASDGIDSATGDTGIHSGPALPAAPATEIPALSPIGLIALVCVLSVIVIISVHVRRKR